MILSLIWLCVLHESQGSIPLEPFRQQILADFVSKAPDEAARIIELALPLLAGNHEFTLGSGTAVPLPPWLDGVFDFMNRSVSVSSNSPSISPNSSRFSPQSHANCGSASKV
jgi:hypothetical protein